ncbi:phytoene desaturase family protein [Evansella sp. AB-rgal1]|uniref:phytoene desaturase family protein n=1 Tax=Evansella sp. AB-rgal1 TaxID=3242696 RepID=UPI00359EA72B
MKGKKIIVVGAGPGGLAAAMILSAKGYDVQVFEKQDYIGGRTSSFSLGEYSFDLGPTFFSMPHILEEIFQSTNRNLHDYVRLKELDPMYSLAFQDVTIQATRDKHSMINTIERNFPGYGSRYEKFMNDTRKKMSMLMPILQNKHDSYGDYLSLKSLRALPSLDLGKSLYDVLSRYFEDERLLLSFTFQSKYLGMSPWKCPGAFSILSFMEYEYGIFHPLGGVNALTKAMARVVQEHGGKIYTGTGVEKIIVENNQICGVQLSNGERIDGDDVVMNADVAHGMTTLIEDDKRKKYKNIKLHKKDYSCSTFMIYAGVNQAVNLDHHTILFSNDYKKNVEQITESMELSEDPSIYIQNAAVTDSTLAPPGKSALYILAPVPNNASNIHWDTEKEAFRDLIWDQIEKKTGISDLRKSMEVEKILTPNDWEQKKHVFRGATFNLAHNLKQMMYYRPHNQVKEIKGLWLVGGGTHPGSGLPTIFESARITTKLLMENKEQREVLQ